jgi:predicted 2-oxoglutarate/Fe(II)-dependent dioxygenase YbiX
MIYDNFSWPKSFSTESINQINKFIDDTHNGLLEDKRHGATKQDGTAVKNISTVKLIPYGQIKHLISDLMVEAYQAAHLELGYITFPQSDNIACHFNIYDSNSKDHYDWHIDKSLSAAHDVKCTILINLSTEPFEGGELQLFPSTEIVDIPLMSEPGSACMFKSHTIHRVKPVTSGTRKTLTVFIMGPKFR